MIFTITNRTDRPLADETLKVDYLGSADTDGIEDAAGNKVANFSETVTTSSVSGDHTAPTLNPTST